MAEKQPEEKREFVRTDFSIHASARRINRREYDRKQSVKRLLSSARYPHQGQLEASDADFSDTALSDFTAFLIQINEKLDRVLDIIGTDKPDPKLVDIKETLNISGSGVSLLLRQPVEVGQLLDLSLSLPNFPLGVLKTQGEVIRILPQQGENEDLFEAGIRFLNLTEEEREKLVGFTFSQQRRNIRGQKSYS
jgi:c-di-GMP-binding flagellar brake protein YcgR